MPKTLDDQRPQLVRQPCGSKRIKYSSFRYIFDFYIWCDEALWAYGFSYEEAPAPKKLPFTSEKEAKTAARKLAKEAKQDWLDSFGAPGSRRSIYMIASDLTSDLPEFSDLPNTPFPISYEIDYVRNEIDFYGLDGHVFGAVRGFYGSQAFLSLEEGETPGLWAIARQGDDENVARFSTKEVSWDSKTVTPNYVEIAIPILQEFMKGLSLDLTNLSSTFS